MAFGLGPKVVKHCPEGHVMDMSWRECPRCSGGHAPQETAGRDLLDATIVEGAPVRKAPAPPPPPKHDWVVLLSAEGVALDGRDVPITVGRWKVGRAPRDEAGVTGVPVRDPSMSRDHFFLEVGAAAAVLRDVGSTNGTYVNGARVQRHVLREGDTIRAGETTFHVRVAVSVP